MKWENQSREQYKTMKKINLKHSYVCLLLKCDIWRLFTKLIFFSRYRLTNFALFSRDRQTNFAIFSHDQSAIFCGIFHTTDRLNSRFFSHDRSTNFVGVFPWPTRRNSRLFFPRSIDKFRDFFFRHPLTNFEIFSSTNLRISGFLLATSSRN